MYQMSQVSQVSQVPQYSRLEHIAHQGNIAYSIAAPSPQQSYNFFVFSQKSFAYDLLQSATFPAIQFYLADVSAHTNYAYSQRNTNNGSLGGSLGHYLSAPSHREYHFQPDEFLKPGKGGKFVGKAEEIREFVEEAFEKMLNCQFPQDIKIAVCAEEQFRKLAPHPGTIGLSINRRKQGLLSEIFVLQGSLGRVLLTVGHELGHVFTGTLEHAQDEEAKAYAFSMAWMDLIKEHNIAGLGNAFVEESPAHNGLHDVAFGFISKMLKQGRKARELWEVLIAGELAVAG